jgi:hypothetical protein
VRAFEKVQKAVKARLMAFRGVSEGYGRLVANAE